MFDFWEEYSSYIDTSNIHFGIITRNDEDEFYDLYEETIDPTDIDEDSLISVEEAYVDDENAAGKQFHNAVRVVGDVCYIFFTDGTYTTI